MGPSHKRKRLQNRLASNMQTVAMATNKHSTLVQTKRGRTAVFQPHGSGSKIGSPRNGTLVNGNMDSSLRWFGGLILTHTHMGSGGLVRSKARCPSPVPPPDLRPPRSWRRPARYAPRPEAARPSPGDLPGDTLERGRTHTQIVLPRFAWCTV